MFMTVVRILEVGFVALGLLFVVTQMIIPGVSGLPMFPILRKKTRRQEQDENFAAMNHRLDEFEHRIEQQSALEARIAKLERTKETKDGSGY